MKKRKIFLGLALAVATVFTLGSCGDKEEETPAASSQAAASSQVVASSEAAQSSQVVASSEAAQSSQTAASSEAAQSSQAAESSGPAEAGDEEKSVKLDGVEKASIAAALAAIPTSGDTNTYTITLGKGTYEENGLAYDGSATIRIVGDTNTKYGTDVIIKGHGSDMSQEKTRNLISIRGTGNIILENLTLESDWTRTMAGGNNAQAEVLGTDTKGNTVAYNGSFKSHQDTLRTAGKAWFYGCYVEGDVDFIWMEQAGSVALYENCEIVSVYDSTATSHGTYFTAPRMAKSNKVGKGLVIYNSIVTETAEAKTNNQDTYLARNAWAGSNQYYNQVAYVNTNVTATINANVWKSAATETEFEKTKIGFKMDQDVATAIGYAGNGDILSAAEEEAEFAGRENIINRVFNTGKQKYEKDANYWDINALIESLGYSVTADTSKSTLDGEVAGETYTYKFDGSSDLSDLTVTGFSSHSSGSYQGGSGASIVVPVTGKCYVEVYGFYSGTVETSANGQGAQVMFFNNGSTSAEIENDYIVYDANATSVTIDVKSTTYITKIVVSYDNSIEYTAVSDIAITGSTTNYCVGVPLNLTAKVNPGNATNKSIVWTSNKEEIATIDKYTGKVTFLAAGEVTFTATATDGSAVTQTFTCTAVEAKWVAAEWYTTDTKYMNEEDGATEIGVFDMGETPYKDLKASYTFTNLSGAEVTTGYGLKQNSSGFLTFSTTKGNATLTVVLVNNINAVAQPKVNDGTVNATLLSTSTTGNLTTYVFDIDHAGLWKIARGADNAECNPILYAKVVYETRITKNTFVTFKGTSYQATGTNAVTLNHNAGDILMDTTTNPATFDNITYSGVKNNNANNWLWLGSGSTITFTTSAACSLYLCYYQGNNTGTVTLNGTAVELKESTGTGDQTKFFYDLTEAGALVYLPYVLESYWWLLRSIRSNILMNLHS